MTLPGALHSDHVNYLVFRYLQEHGHEETAKQFYRDWHRPREFRDPEDLPFARAVHRHELISVIQDGLRHDDLQTRVTRSKRRFTWLNIDPRRSVDAEADDVDISGLNGSRPSSSGKRKSIGAGSVVQVDDSAPALKRQRLETQVNGHHDAMNIDARSSSVEENEDETLQPDPVSPAVASDGTADALATRYDSVATQTEVANAQRIPPSRLKSFAMTTNLEKQSSKIYHVAWSPSASTNNRDTFFLTGESLCRMYRAPEHLSAGTAVLEHMDTPEITDGCMITAMTWHPKGRLITCAVDTIEESHSGDDAHAACRVISIGPDVGGTYTHFPNSDILQPPGVAIRIEYSPNGEYLLIARTNIDRGLIEVWPTTQTLATDASITQPIAWKIFEFPLSDAAWSNDQQIIVCTHNEHVSLLTLSPKLHHVEKLTENNFARHNVEDVNIVVPSKGDVDTTYKCDSTHAIDIFFVRPYEPSSSLDSQDQMIIFDSALYETDAYLKLKKTFDLNWTYVTSALQPTKPVEDGSNFIQHHAPARLLATIFENGGCRLFELNRDSSGIVCKPLFSQEGYTFKMSYGPALAMAWSTDGAYLAIAGRDIVQIWSVQSFADMQDVRPVLTWRPDRPHVERVQHSNGIVDKEASKPVCLSWDSQSRRLCFAADNTLTLIECERTDMMNGVQTAQCFQP